MLEPDPRPARRGLFVLYFLLAVGLLSCTYLYADRLGLVLTKIQETVQLLGPAAPVGMAIVGGLWGTLCLPGPLLQGALATMFSSLPWMGLAVAVVGETIAQASAFSLARHAGRDKVRQALSGKEWFLRLEQQTDSKGAYGVCLFRLMPFFPNALASYAFGLTSLAFVPYLLASVVGSLPKLFVYIFGTTTLLELARGGRLTPGMVGAMALVALVGTLLARWWQKRLRRRVSTDHLRDRL